MSESTHMISYMSVFDAGRRIEYGMFDVTLPAGWIKVNRDWCVEQLTAKHPGATVIITGVTEYKRALNVGALREALMGLAVLLDQNPRNAPTVAEGLRKIVNSL